MYFETWLTCNLIDSKDFERVSRNEKRKRVVTRVLDIEGDCECECIVLLIDRT